MKRVAFPFLIMTALFACRKNDEQIPIVPDIQFNIVYGSAASEQVFAAARTLDGGYVLAGSIKGVNGNPQNSDMWMLLLDKQGKMKGQKTFGGSALDVASSIASTRDGGYVLAGSTYSNDGDVAGNHGNADAWVVKVDMDGNKQWQKVLGGSSVDYGNSIIETSDGGYIIAGQTASTGGDVTYNHGMTDVWVMKLDKNGNQLWQKTFGGTGSEGANSIIETSEGEYIMAGWTNSNDGDVTGYHVGSGMWIGNLDGWVVRISKEGNLLWNRAFGGSNTDVFNSLIQGMDKSYTIAGNTRSNDFDEFGNHGNGDAWLINIDKDGKVVWRKHLGGSGGDFANSISSMLDGGYIMAGFTSSNDGDVTANHGGDDAWVVRLDRAGNKQWQRALGGSGNDIARSIFERANGSYVMVGSTGSNDGDVIGQNGAGGVWIITMKDQ